MMMSPTSLNNIIFIKYQVLLCFVSVQVRRHYDHQRRMWDDDLVLKCQHNALVPAFDPRPGRTNVQQTQDIEIPAPGKTTGLNLEF